MFYLEANVYSDTYSYRLEETYPLLRVHFGDDGKKRHPATGLNWFETKALSNAARAKWSVQERREWYKHVERIIRSPRGKVQS